jgi:hypothetical protein
MGYSTDILDAVKALDKIHADFDRDFTPLAYIAQTIDGYSASDMFERAIAHQCQTAWQLYLSMLLLLAKGFGFSGAVVSRSLYEYVCGAKYLIKERNNSKVFSDFMDYGLKALYEAIIDKERIPPKLELEYQRAVDKFKGNEKWHRKKLVDIAHEVGLGGIYRTFYRLMSSVAHAEAFPAIMEAGIDWKGAGGVPYNDLLTEYSLEGSYMLMTSLYESAVKCLPLHCDEELKLLTSLRNKRLRVFAGEDQTDSPYSVQ